ncbi:MAG: hypothetical protein ACK4ZM_01290 [bacterium]
MNFTLYLLVGLLLFIVLVIRNIFKAYVVYMMGDPGPKYRGLLSANPVSHVDPVGTLFLFITPIISGGSFVIGWTRYVDYDPSYFRNRDFAEMLVGVAGLGSFFVVIFLSRVLISFFPELQLIFYFLAITKNS